MQGCVIFKLQSFCDLKKMLARMDVPCLLFSQLATLVRYSMHIHQPVADPLGGGGGGGGGQISSRASLQASGHQTVAHILG